MALDGTLVALIAAVVAAIVWEVHVYRCEHKEMLAKFDRFGDYWEFSANGETWRTYPDGTRKRIG